MKKLVVAFLILASGGIHAQKITEVQLVEYGVLKKMVSGGLLDAPNSLTGKVNNAMASKLVQSGDTIKAAVGTTFGIGVKPLGEPEGAAITLRFRCTHPKLTDPVSGHSGDVDEWDGTCPIGHLRYVSYTFDHDWELAPGKWTIQVLYDGKVLAEKTFDVLAP